MRILATITTLCFSWSSLYAATVVLEYNTGRPYLTSIATLPGKGATIPYYDEDGFLSKPVGPISTTAPYKLCITGPNSIGNASNGTAHLSLLNDNSFEVFSLEGQLFDAVSIDLAEYSTVFQRPKTISFEGILGSGASVFVSFTTDGFIQGGNALNDFETFTFPVEFSNLSLLRSMTTGYSLDNLTLRVVPEPTLLSILSISLLGVVTRRTRR